MELHGEGDFGRNKTLAIVEKSSSRLRQDVIRRNEFSQVSKMKRNTLHIANTSRSGESRSLMKEVAYLAASKQEKLGTLKLMVIYRSTERMLADLIGATEGITILCYHHSVSYKYQGRLRAQNILSSVYHFMSLQPEELPLKPLNTLEDLKAFFESTDRAVLLLEFCGWTPTLLSKGNNNGSDNKMHGGILGENFEGETNKTLPSGKQRQQQQQQKGLKIERLTSEVENELSGIPWVEGFTSRNDSAPLLEIERRRPDFGVSCSYEEFQRFESFFSKLTKVAREFFLPPEKQRFGLVSEKSMLSSLGVGVPDSWLVMLHFTGCPNCSKILREGDDLKDALQMDLPLVTEVEGEGHDLEPALPAKEPSIILFVDRLSESSHTRGKSKEALDALRELALHNQLSNQIDGQNNVNSKDFSIQAFQERSKSITYPSGHPTTQMVKLKDRMAVMIINEGEKAAFDNIAADAHGRSMHDILLYRLQQKKEEKLSLFAKEVGFQLLSDDFEVKVTDLLPSQTEFIQSDQVSSELLMEAIVESNLNLDKDTLQTTASKTAVELEEQAGLTGMEPSPQYNKAKITCIEKSTTLTSAEPDQIIMTGELGSAENMRVEKRSSMQVDKLGEQQVLQKGFKGSYFFSDGGYQLLRALTAESKIPSMVILDPISQQHYVFPEEAVFSYSSLVDFLDGFLNGSLLPYRRSESVPISSREATRPPFVNLDFREVDFIPRITAHTFSELILGFNKSDSQNVGLASKKDVLVLFSNSWCGFCQRMELVVREVYRAFKGYMNVFKSGSRKRGSVSISGDDLDEINSLKGKLAKEFEIKDLGLLNSILKSLDQRERYPALILFPAERKNAVSYQGDVAVTNVIKFLADQGSNSRHLNGDEGILWSGEDKGGRNRNLIKAALTTSIHEDTPAAKGNYHEVLLNNRTPTREIKDNPIRSHTSNDLHEPATHVVVGSVLNATDRLLNAPPFDKSTVLIVKADHVSGFQGLIINKHIKWDILQELDEGLELLKQAPLSFGGPLIAHGMPLVSLTRGITKERYPEVLPSVYFLDQFATIKEIEGLKSGNQSTIDSWFFLGYSSWGWEQLFDEIAEGAWHISDDQMGHLYWPLS
ncbi:hypothetical protein HHK36_024100 [Tetracentron sinense]|uniref:Thioredoxin domain-containing protein n=1 Tax=Tetracentron sinense TaxID=13715 RepID=A0A835D770_TETSI|nr:hypothetical protein HHK36_024100 [Tetracentron sinense]